MGLILLENLTARRFSVEATVLLHRRWLQPRIKSEVNGVSRSTLSRHLSAGMATAA